MNTAGNRRTYEYLGKYSEKLYCASEEQIVCKESKRTEKIHAFIGKMPAEISVGITCF